MVEEFYAIAIVALLPLTACMLVTQVNPYHALVIRGILGAVAALVYALFGAADVALTEALVGTMLSITLYAVAVRSSMSLRLGILVDPEAIATETSSSDAAAHLSQPLTTALRDALRQSYLRLEIFTYPTLETLQVAFKDKEVHAICLASDGISPEDMANHSADVAAPYHLCFRVHRLYSLMMNRLAPTVASLSYVDVRNSDEVVNYISPKQSLNMLEG